ncbi:flagellar motor switch protein FliM [Bacillus luti]|nr:flagellar motor switch protein FliM [Bacillus cereus]
MNGEQVLNQSEINALLEKLRSGGNSEADVESKGSAEQYQEYDFNRPDKFNLENIRSLESIAKAFARGFSQELSAKCRYPITIKLSKRDNGNIIEQVPYATEYIRGVGKDRWAFCVVDLGLPDLGRVILQMDMAFTRPIHQNLLGSGERMEWEEEVEPLSEMDALVMQDWVESTVFPSLRNSFQNVEQFHLVLQSIETDPQYVKITRDSDVIALIPFDIEFGSEDDKLVRAGGIQLCIPYLSIEAISEKLTTENAIEYQLSGDISGQEEMMRRHLEMVNTKVDVEIGRGVITVRELLNLKNEDVITLNRKVRDRMIGYVGGVPKFSCKPGRSDERYAVKVTGFSEKAQGGELNG